MPHFENARIRDINQGTFVDVKGDAHVLMFTGGGLSGFEIIYRNVAESAFHDSGARFPQPKCHPETRKAVMETIMAWLKADDDDGDLGEGRSAERRKKPILWLHAPAGAGKSAIAQSIADLCCTVEPSGLAASFFFSRNVAERNTEKHLTATLVYQVARSIPAAKPFIENVVMDDPCIFSRTLEVQFTNLIARPLIQAAGEDPFPSQWPTLVLLDGLDECIAENDGELKQCAIIKAICATLTRFDIPLRFLIASRPEPHLRDIFEQPDVLCISRYLKLDKSFNPERDIETFLRAELACICTGHPSMVSVVDWPSRPDIKHLIHKSSEQFIYAATVVKFVGDRRHNPLKRLGVVLHPSTDMPPSPFTNLYTLYRQVLEAAQPNHITAIVTIFSIVLHNALWPLTLADIAGLMTVPVQDVKLLLYDLHSIVNVSDTTPQVSFFHASFSDFLQTQSQAGPYYVVLNKQCECIGKPWPKCYHTYARECWFFGLDVTPLTPTLLNGLEQYFLKVSKEFDANIQLNKIAGVIGSLENRPEGPLQKIHLDFLELFDKTIRKVLDSEPSGPSANTLIALSVLLLPYWKLKNTAVNNLQNFMIMIYSSENISTCRISEILEPDRIKMFSSLVEQVHTRSQLLKFFKDPSRSAAYFLGDMNAQLAMWSLTTLIWDPSNLHKNHVPSFELELIFSPILINFPNPINPALGIGLHEDLAKPIVQFLLDDSKAYELLLKQITKNTPYLDMLWTLTATIRKVYYIWDPVSLEDLRSRFAEQRAHGVDYQISEEEEVMLLDTLGRIRLRTSATLERSQESIVDGEEISSGRQSIRSTTPSTSSLTSSPSGRSAK
ncbi:hypothetical protein K443DRAFT_3514 [Laccaria amethystina LaAM-08-1]|uniref:Nephrocystin 3-like N-terminal domain-containing protein n=1 Tax=Laccaria amethystina LaAM-08-1 TaxID=1095629 RepID=A0A0C9X1L8_9AGAR|nr:hypothetical protein K443DRAFT_3514 [Laccaria amethystina LaAM-08-1]